MHERFLSTCLTNPILLFPLESHYIRSQCRIASLSCKFLEDKDNASCIFPSPFVPARVLCMGKFSKDLSNKESPSHIRIWRDYIQSPALPPIPISSFPFPTGQLSPCLLFQFGHERLRKNIERLFYTQGWLCQTPHLLRHDQVILVPGRPERPLGCPGTLRAF